MLNIRIKNSNKILYLPPDIKLRFEMNSPLFNENAIPQGVVYPFDIPAAPNQDALNNTNFIQINRATRAYDAVFEFVTTLFSGKLLVDKVSKKKYRCTLVVNRFSVDYKNTSLKDVQFSNLAITDTVSNHAKQVATGLIDRDYQFPKVYAKKFYGEVDPDTKQSKQNYDYGGDPDGNGNRGRYINNYDAANETFYENEIGENYATNVFTFVPFFKLTNIIYKLFDVEKYSVFGEFMRDPRIKKLLIANNYPLDSVTMKYKFQGDEPYAAHTSNHVLLFQDNQVDSDNVFSSGEYEIKAAGEHTFEVNLTGDYNDTKTLTLSMYSTDGSTDTLITSEDWLSTGAITLKHTKYFTAAEIGHKVYFETSCTSGGSPANYTIIKGSALMVNYSISKLNEFKNVIDITNHLPDMTIGEFLNAIKNVFQLGIWINDVRSEIQVGFKSDVIKSQRYLDLSDKLLIDNYEISMQEEEGIIFNLDADADTIQSLDNFTQYGSSLTNNINTIYDADINALQYITNINTYYQYRRDEENKTVSWQFYSQGQYPVEISGQNMQELIPPLVPLNMHQKGNENDFICPEYQQEATSPSFSMPVIDIPLQLMMYQGMQPDADSNNYPFASVMKYNYEGTELTDSFNLKAKGDDGIFETFHRTWFNYMRKKEVMKAKFSLKTKDIFNIMRLFQPQHGEEVRKVRVEERNWIPRRFTFQLTMNGVQESEAELVKDGGEDV